jgi:hypothetical protein
LNFQQQNPLEKQYLPHLSFENYEINSMKSDLLRAFQEYQELLQIPIQFSVLILFNFHRENGSIISSFHTIAQNSLKPSQCTPHSLRPFLRYQEHNVKSHGLGVGEVL